MTAASAVRVDLWIFAALDAVFGGVVAHCEIALVWK
jgi:hypothetical protein